MRKVFLFLLISCFLCGCAPTHDLDSHWAEVHYCYFTAESEHFFVDLWSGKREEPYKQDSAPQKLVDFTLLSIKPKTEEKISSCSVEINGKVIVVNLEQSPFDKTLACDLGSLVNENDKITVYFSLDISESVQLYCESKNYCIDYTKACEICSSKAQEFLADKEEFEVYLKIISSTIDREVQFWYFKILSGSDELVCVIDVNTGEILVCK